LLAFVNINYWPTPPLVVVFVRDPSKVLRYPRVCGVADATIVLLGVISSLASYIMASLTATRTRSDVPPPFSPPLGRYTDIAPFYFLNAHSIETKSALLIRIDGKIHERIDRLASQLAGLDPSLVESVKKKEGNFHSLLFIVSRFDPVIVLCVDWVYVSTCLIDLQQRMWQAPTHVHFYHRLMLIMVIFNGDIIVKLISKQHSSKRPR
jgi:hypothetical protein